MPSTANLAIRAVVRGLAQGGALNVGQMHAIYHAIEGAALDLERQGDHTGASELREMIDNSFGERNKNG